MISVLNKTSVAIIAFTLLEAFVLRMAVLVPLRFIGSVFPNDLVFNLVGFAIAAVIAFFAGKFLFQKWSARIGVKITVACGIVIVTFLVSSYLLLVVDRYLLQKNY